MRTLLFSSVISLATVTTPALANEKSAQIGLAGSKYSGITDGVDMQGGGITSIELLADKIIEKIQTRWKIQSNVLREFKTALQDPFFRNAASSLATQGPESYATTYNLIITHMDNPVVSQSFEKYGVLQGIVELAYSIEKARFGRILQIDARSVDAKTATLKLYHAATSPLEVALKYSASYRYGID